MNVPSRVIIQQLREQHISELRLGIKAIQAAVLALRSISDFNVPHSADPAAWQAALDQATERREAARRAVNESLVLTGEQKAESLKGWRAWHFTISKHIGTIIRTLQKWPQASWQWDAVASTITPGRTTAAIADMMATKPVPAEAQEHGRLLGKIYESIADLRRWEQHHGVRKLPIEALLKIDSESLGEQWATGSIMRQTGLDSATMSRVHVFESTFI